MAGVPHLNEIGDHGRANGFEIVAVSAEGADTIQTKMIDGKKPTYGIVKANINSLYQTNSIPHCWVLDADGKCIFKGHPNGVTTETVDEWTKDIAPTKIDKELGKPLKDAVKAFEAGQYGKALNEAKKVEASAEDDLVKADAKYVQDFVQKHVDVYTAKMNRLREAGDLVKLGTVMEEAALKFDGSDQGETWADEAKTLKKSDEYKDTVKASEELEKLRPKLEDMKRSSANKALAKIAKKYPETAAGKEAAELAKRYE